jgi:hypothetical protein
MAITDFFQEFVRTFIKKKPSQILSIRSFEELQYVQNDTNYCFRACNKPITVKSKVNFAHVVDALFAPHHIG